MADLTAKFRLIDEMSSKMESIASSGETVLSSWERAGAAADAAFGTAVSAVDGVAASIADLNGTADSAATATGHWTDAVGNYEKGALEAIYSTEELVEMGLKSATALEEQERMFELCEQSADSLSKAMEVTADIQDELNAAMEHANENMAELEKNEEVSAETKQELEKASGAAAEAMRELSAAQEEAAAAMDEYDKVMSSGADDLSTLESAAEKACHAAEALAEANGKANEATEGLAKATEKASEEAENSGKSGAGAAEAIAGALASAGITDKVTEIAEAVYELADAFSEAESIIVKATGATGEALDDLTTSMMDAYAASKTGSLEDTAGAIGEINTRMGLTGERLTEVTGLFLDYASITGTDVVGSVQNVTKVMNQWGVEGSEVESVLDKLSYAGQISGASVDSLSSSLISGAASFQQAGLSLDSAIQMLCDFELAGISSTTAITAMRTAINGFADDGLDAETALQEVINEIANMESATDATALAVDTFGSKAGQQLAAAIRNGTVSVDSFSASLDAADGTLKTTAAAAQTLDEKWTQAGNNISVAFTTAVQPTLDGISSGFASLANGFGTFLNEHPAVTKALTAIGVGVGVVALGIAGVTFSTTVAIPAIAAFGATLSAAIWPITLIAAAVAAVVAAVLFLVDAFSAAEDETAGVTAVTRTQYYELQDLTAEYEKACEKYGETSEEALRLKYQVDDLSAAFEANRQTVEEFTAEVDALIQSHDGLISSYEESMAAISQNEVGTLALVQKLEDLATQTDRTAAQEEQMKAVINQLNSDLPDLALSYDDVTSSTGACVEAMKKAAEAQAEQERQAEQKQIYVDLLKEQANLEEEIAKAEENVRLEQERMDEMSGWTHFWTRGEWDSLEAYQDALDQLNASYAENQAALKGIESDWEEVAAATAEAEAQTVSYEDAVNKAISGISDDMNELCEAYDAAYEAARSSIDGTIGLFDTMSTECETSVEDMMAALQSQTEYLNTYAENLRLAAEYGLDDGLIASLSDGSEESAGYLNAIIKQIEALGGTTEEMSADAQAFVDEFNTSFAEVEEAKDQFAATIADMETNFTETLDAMNEALIESIEEMHMDTEATEAAKATMDAYIQSIKNQQADAVSAAASVANAVSSALSTTQVTAGTNSVRGYAVGTLDAAPGLALVGEEGPELINFGGGEIVYTSDETERILNGGNDYQTETPKYSDSNGENIGQGSVTMAEEKKITIEVAGSGSIGAGSGTSKEQILDVLLDNLEQILEGILQTEIYEEGDLAYDY